MSTVEPLFSDRAIDVVVRELDAAAERIIEHRTEEERRGVKCPTCGQVRSAIRPGHIYLLIGCFMFLAIAAIGALSK